MSRDAGGVIDGRVGKEAESLPGWDSVWNVVRRETVIVPTNETIWIGAGVALRGSFSARRSGLFSVF